MPGGGPRWAGGGRCPTPRGFAAADVADAMLPQGDTRWMHTVSVEWSGLTLASCISAAKGYRFLRCFINRGAEERNVVRNTRGETGACSSDANARRGRGGTPLHRLASIALFTTIVALTRVPPQVGRVRAVRRASLHHFRTNQTALHPRLDLEHGARHTLHHGASSGLQRPNHPCIPRITASRQSP